MDMLAIHPSIHPSSDHSGDHKEPTTDHWAIDVDHKDSSLTNQSTDPSVKLWSFTTFQTNQTAIQSALHVTENKTFDIQKQK